MGWKFIAIFAKKKNQTDVFNKYLLGICLLYGIWQRIKDFKRYLLGINTIPWTGPAGLLHVLKGET